jgi:hypothetical protein
MTNRRRKSRRKYQNDKGEERERRRKAAEGTGRMKSVTVKNFYRNNMHVWGCS